MNRVILLLGLAVCVGEGDDDFAQGFAGAWREDERSSPAVDSLRQRSAFAVKLGGGGAVREGEGEDVRRLVEAAVFAVQALDFLVTG